MPYKAPEKRKQYNTEYNRGWRGKNKEKVKEIGIKSYYRNVESRKEGARKWKEQQRIKYAGRPRPDKCEVCGRKGKIVFDHDHSTGIFRGWICTGCNSSLGHAYDDPKTLRKLADYLEVKREGIAISEIVKRLLS